MAYHSSGAGLQRPHFRGIYPCNRSKSESVNDNQQVRKGNDSMSLVALHANENVQIAINSTRNIFSTRQDAAHDEMTEAHGNGSRHQEESSTGLVNVEEDNGREDDEQCVLDTRGDQVDISGQTGHLENVDNLQQAE